MSTHLPVGNAEYSTTSTIEPSMSEWSSLDLEEDYIPIVPKRSPKPGELCEAYIAQSDSSVFTHVYYNYPAVLDPGIKEALLEPDEKVIHEDNGQTLYLSLCEEMKVCPVKIFHRNLLNEEINLSYYCVDPRSVRAMSMALNYNRHVRRLILTDNFLSDDACYHLGQMLRCNTTLEELNLSGCRIGVMGLKCLGKNFYQNQTLKALDLSGNNLREEGGKYLATMIMFGMPVERLSLRKNGMGKESAEALSEAFLSKENLTHLDLSWNEFYNAATMSKMLNSLCDINMLSELNLSWNALEGERIAKAITRLLTVPHLTVLDLSNNRLQGSSIGIIVSNLKLAKKLITLDLSYNPMYPNDAYDTLAEMLKKKVKLVNLLMADTWVNKDFIQLLEKIKHMKCRKHFTITYGGVYKNWTVKGPDPRELMLRRAIFLGNQNKKRQVDVALFFMKLLKENSDLWTIKTLLERCEENMIPLSEDFLNGLSQVFPGGLTGKKSYVNMAAVVEFIRRLWPEKKLPPSPKPLEESKPDPVEERRKSGITFDTNPEVTEFEV